MPGWRSKRAPGLWRGRGGGGKMTGGLVIVLVLGTIAIARAKLGDAGYEKIVITVFKWWFGLAAVLILGAVIYNRVLT